MATKKKTESAGGQSSRTGVLSHTEEYARALESYGEALDLLHKGKWAEALERFRAIASEHTAEHELCERSRSYATVCERRLADDPEPPRSADDMYIRGVVYTNQGRLDDALDMFNKALEIDREQPKHLYARASVYALKGQADAAAADLRLAVRGEPVLRFQAANDPDFANVRDEAAFIDVIEPTPTGA